MTDTGGNDRRRDIEGRINTLGAGGKGTGSRGRRNSRTDSADTEADEDDVSSGLTGNGADADDESDESSGTDADALADDAPEGTDASDESDDAEEADASDAEADDEADEDDSPVETRATDVDERSSLEIEMDRFVRAFAARRAEQIGEDNLDEYIVGSVKGYLAGLLGGDVESPGTLKRKIEVEADDIFGGLLDIVADEDQDQGDVVVEAVADAYDVPEEDSLVVAGLRDHEALLNGVVANNSNSLGDVSEVVQAAVETRLIEERAD
ncbi:hypothetical protein JCM30237_05030 [Halolamina litorea]|uniref:Uncharacterized protein n=1 Tax=Halolamina litorea TaxID=1515593 RepID=A0ABD6BPJ6_9EURY|nr:hypothetical protein [Halolamina litorea]